MPDGRSEAAAQLHFAVFMEADSNYHLAGWRLPEAYADTGLNFDRWIELARTMERGKLDMLFIADSHGLAGIDDLETLSRSPRVGALRAVHRALGARSPSPSVSASAPPAPRPTTSPSRSRACSPRSII